MSRPWLLVFVVFLVMFTSQFEWKQEFGEEIEPSPTVSLKDQSVSKRHEYVKEKVSHFPQFVLPFNVHFYLVLIRNYELDSWLLLIYSVIHLLPNICWLAKGIIYSSISRICISPKGRVRDSKYCHE
ncbi:lysine/histidine transporter [Hibiscus syriacus]|uniref:Lysine/histidine transporter n=1 Tax=Hibiscus syriacus TaxID=106335 RepID=A0A6A2X9C0_HIBSY|nr:lysine/histidine transporter [Hibiscus syriacus]